MYELCIVLMTSARRWPASFAHGETSCQFSYVVLVSVSNLYHGVSKFRCWCVDYRCQVAGWRWCVRENRYIWGPVREKFPGFSSYVARRAQSAQEPLSPRLATGYSPGGCAAPRRVRDPAIQRPETKMATEALRTQLDTLRLEKQRLEVENVRLRDSNNETAALIDTEAEATQLRAEAEQSKTENERLASEVAQLKALYEQLLFDSQEEQARRADEQTEVEDLKAALERANQQREDAEARTEALEAKLTRVRDGAELEIFRAVAAERQQWEIREERLVRQIQRLESDASVDSAPTSARVTARDEPHRDRPAATEETASTTVPTTRDRSEGHVRGGVAPTETVTEAGAHGTGAPGTTEPLPNLDGIAAAALSSVALAQQLPPLPKFTGESQGVDGETFQDWRAQFELIASVFKWDDPAKLINLVARLRGQAFAFYRSCNPEHRSSYAVLVEELSKRFTPVHIHAVQSTLFHERKQGAGECVDDFAQDLRRLFRRAYPTAQLGTTEANSMGQSVLAYQFVAGLRPVLKAKLAGSEGKLEQLLLKARFEEAKIRDLAISSQSGDTTPKGSRRTVPALPSSGVPGPKGSHTQTPDREPRASTGQEGSRGKPAGGARCFNCGQVGHYSRNCPQRGRARQNEAPGKSHTAKTVAQVASDSDSGKQQLPQQKAARIAELRRQLQEAELEEAITTVEATMHGITPEALTRGTTMGPTPTARVWLEGKETEALLDTGSPVSIVSLQFLLGALALARKEDESLAAWRAKVQERLEPPTITLRNYSGGKLNIVREIQVCISRPGFPGVTTTVQVQHDAPTELLLGTDVLSGLGFVFLQTEQEGADIDLLEPLPKELGDRNQEVGVVRLIGATTVPARHQKLLRAQMAGCEEALIALFEPDNSQLARMGLTMAEAIMEPDKDHCVTLIVENQSVEPTQLVEGQVLGKVYPALLQPLNEEGLDDAEPVVKRMTCTGPNAAVGSTPLENRGNCLLSTLQVDETDLSADQKRALETLLTEFSDVFALDPSELGSTNLVAHAINTGNSPPIRQPPRRTPFALRAQVNKMVQQMLEQGVIEPSQSPWASPVVLVQKKDGSSRFCVDYRRLNSVTKLDVFPLPRIDDTLDSLSRAKYFTTLDLASGYWQVGMHPQSKEKTAFVTTSGLYQFTVMPFGLCNAPATFQRLMESVLAGLARECCMVYLDDILVTGTTFEDHLINLRLVLTRIREAGLRLKPTKCKFAQREVVYLGYVVSGAGISPDAEKVKAVQAFPTPLDLKSLRSFLGLASYYRRFIPQFSAIASPLHALTKKNAEFIWSPACEVAFGRLKQLLTDAPVLAFPKFGQEFRLETDASGVLQRTH